MKNLTKITGILLTSALLLCAAGCKADLVPAPSTNKTGTKNPADYADSISAPANLTVSHGLSKEITLSWDSLPNAVSYNIYSDDTGFKEASKIAETKETSITLDDQSAGVTKYFQVTAVNYYGTESHKSEKYAGSTLSVPLITDIESSDSGTEVTVSWWMDNCSKNTYLDDIEYKVYAYDSSKKDLNLTQTVENTKNSAVITGLSSNTEYYFSVQVVNTKCDAFESSDLIDATSAHNLIPDGAVNFTADQGVKTDSLTLSWQLPSPAWYYESAGYYSQHPVYFTILRKEAEKADDTYETIAAYIGINQDKKDEANKKYVFDCSEPTNNSSVITIDSSTTGVNSLTPDAYSAYTSDTKISFTDTTAVRGKKYTYKIKSYTDYYSGSNPLTNENSDKTTDGWLIAPASFNIQSEYEIDLEDETKITSVKLTYVPDFETYGKSYSYVLTQKICDLSDVSHVISEEKITAVYNDLTALNNAAQEISTADAGYYFYNFYIVEYNESLTTESAVPTEYLIQINVPGNITVTDDATKIPSIEHFTVTDGYSNKFILSWDHIASGTDSNGNSFLEYTVTYTPYDSAGVAQEPVSVTLSPTDYSDDNTTVTYECPADSGDVRSFTLKANTGCSATKVDSTKYKTLGTAAPVMGKIDYKKITVSWDKVQMADSYTVSAFYADDEAKANNLVTAENTTQTPDADGNITCVIDCPAGYDDATVAGKEILFDVQAVNTKDNTNKEISVRNLGPALVETKADTTNNYTDRLIVTWKKIDGATGYIIYRNKYGYDDNWTNWTFERADKYFCQINEDGSTTIQESGEAVGTRATVTLSSDGTTYTLIDRYVEPENSTSAYETNQSQISWGIPFGYVVLPVNGDKDDFNFGTDTDYLKITDGNSGVVYTNTFTDQKTAAIGYGLNVTAAKSESASAVKITWAKPYKDGLIPYVYKMPFNKEENHDYTSSWTKVNAEALTSNATSFEDTLSVDTIANAFVYAVQYEAPSASDFSKSYRDKLANTKTDTEANNKGYLLTLKNFNAAYGGTDTTAGNESYYQENITWDKTWDYEERALGPDSFTIDIKNRNLSSTMSWTTIASGEIKENVQSVTPATGLDDTTVGNMTAGGGITIKPVGLTAGTATETNGLLKVLRDAKHYYSVNLKRGNNDAVRQAADNTIYAYRQISNEELCKCVGLIIADALYQTGIPTHEWTIADGTNHKPDSKTLSGNGGGSFYITHYSWENTCVWGLTNYKHSFINGYCSSYTDTSESEFTLSSNSSSKLEGISANTLYYLPPVTIQTIHESGLSSYNAKLVFSAGSEGTSTVYNLSITVNDKAVISVSKNQTDFYKYFPYDIGNKHISADSTVNTSLQTYQGDWWN